MGKNNYFWCERGHNEFIAEAACINRFKKGLKKCEGCKTGYSLLVTHYALNKEGESDVEDGSAGRA